MPGYLDPQHLADLAKDLNLTAQEVEAFVTANSTVRAFLDQAVNTSQQDAALTAQARAIVAGVTVAGIAGEQRRVEA